MNPAAGGEGAAAAPRELVIATRNADKVREIADILSGVPFRLTSLLDHPQVPEIEETGETLRENALIKARTAARFLSLPALADDTGLEVEALDGAPGVLSSRYAGERASYEENWRKLLEAMSGVPLGARGARFVTVAAFVPAGSPEGPAAQAASGEIIVEGEVRGAIAAEARGEAGFGYDPVFLVPELGRTFAELELAEKQRLSHRGRAFRAMREALAARFGLR